MKKIRTERGSAGSTIVFILAAIVVVASWSVCRAQEESGEPQEPVKNTGITTKFHLEITVPQVGTSYMHVTGRKNPPGSVFFSRFIRTSTALEAGRLPIQLIRVSPVFNGKTADVSIYVLRGVEAYEEEELVGVYQVAVDEQKTVTRLREFGIEPFTIKLVDKTSSLPPVPEIQNNTQAVEIVRVRRENIPTPAYRITFKNVSDKRISALKVEVISTGGGGPTAFFEGLEGRPFIEPGGVADGYMPVLVAVRSGDSYVPGTSASNTINIRSVVFDDLSYEGEVDRACMLESDAMGKRLWLKRVLPFIDQELAQSNVNDDTIEAAKQFKEKFSKLHYTLDESDQSSSVSPPCQNPGKAAIAKAKGMKLILLDELDRLIDHWSKPPANFKSWLEKKRTSYSAWLARL